METREGIGANICECCPVLNFIYHPLKPRIWKGSIKQRPACFVEVVSVLLSLCQSCRFEPKTKCFYWSSSKIEFISRNKTCSWNIYLYDFQPNVASKTALSQTWPYIATSPENRGSENTFYEILLNLRDHKMNPNEPSIIVKYAKPLSPKRLICGQSIIKETVKDNMQ